MNLACISWDLYQWIQTPLKKIELNNHISAYSDAGKY